MNLSIQLTPEDYIQAVFLHMRPRPVLKWIGYFLLLLTVVVLAMSFYLAIARQDSLALPLFLLGVLVYLAFIFLFLLPRRLRKIFRQQKSLHSPHSFAPTDEAVLIKSAVGDQKLTWDYFRKWKEGKNLFTIYQSDAVFNIIPKRFFVSAEDMAQFRQLLLTKLGPAGV